MHSRLDPASPSLHAPQGLPTLRLFGPDLCCGFDYFNEFLQALTPGVLDAATVHRSGRHQSLTVSSPHPVRPRGKGLGLALGCSATCADPVKLHVLLALGQLKLQTHTLDCHFLS